MIDKRTTQYGLDALMKEGASKAHVTAKETVKHEFNVETGQLSLLRTTHDSNLQFRAIKDGKKGDFVSNKADRISVAAAAAQTLNIALASEPDTAWDIAEKQPAEEFSAGPAEPDRDLMYDRLSAFCRAARERFPKTIINTSVLHFEHSRTHFLNSNGVDFTIRKGVYGISAMFVSKDGGNSSSMSYTGLSMRDLGRELLECGTMAEHLSQSAEQTNPAPLKGKFEGEIILAPDAVDDLLSTLIYAQLTDIPLITGTSLLKDKLDMPVASPSLTVRSCPTSGDLAQNYFLTNDGYKAQDCTIIDKGVLKTFLLGLYGANKTGKKRAVTNGACLIVDPGKPSRHDLVKSVKKGLYVVRLSGGQPNDKGDFSAIAKNSYLIEDGEIRYPVKEAMISGNILDFFRNISEISSERINFGESIYPWIRGGGVTLSGQ